jgi:hypothetical protein
MTQAISVVDNLQSDDLAFDEALANLIVEIEPINLPEIAPLREGPKNGSITRAE